MKKRLLSVFLAIVMVLSLAGVAFAAGAEDFSDVKEGQWYYEYVDDVANLGYFVGYPDGTFRPGNDITRAEVVLVLARMAQRLGLARDYDLDAKKIDETPFEDVSLKEWYSVAVKWAADEEITLGMGNNKFAPHSPVTREDACTLICRFIDYVGEHKGTYYVKHYNASLIYEFEDEDQIRDYAAEAVDTCMAYGLVEGFTDHTFQPRSNWTRAQGAKMISILHDVLDVPDEPYVPPYNPPVEEPCTIEDDLEAGKTVTLTENHTLCRNIVIPAGVTSKLDLNGYTLTIATDKVVDVVSILGSLTATNGTIIIECPESEEAINFYSGLCVEEGGKLNLDNVTIIGRRLWNIENNGTLNLTNANCTVEGGYGISNSGAAVIKNCTMVADGDSVTQIYSTAGTVDVVNTKFVEGTNFVSYSYHAPIQNYYSSKLTMTDVTVTVTPGEMVYTFINALGATTTINSGEFNTVFSCGNQGGVVTIYGGTFHDGTKSVKYADITANSKIFEGYKFQLVKGENCWIVRQGQPVDPTPDTRAVEDRLEAGEEVTLTANHTLDRTVEIPANANAVLDLNGYTLTVAHEDVDDLISVLGSLTVTNGTIIIECPEDKNAINFYSGLCVEEGGKLDLDNVTIIGRRLWNIENNGTLNLTNANYTVEGGYGISNSGAAVIKNCTMVADGDSVTQIYSTAGTVDVVNTKFVEGTNFVSYSYHAPIENYYSSKLTMTGVTVTVTPGEMVYSFINALGATTTINSGEFNAVFSCGNQGGIVTIYGGTFCGIAYENLTANSQIFEGYKFKLTEGENCWIVSQ